MEAVLLVFGVLCLFLLRWACGESETGQKEQKKQEQKAPATPATPYVRPIDRAYNQIPLVVEWIEQNSKEKVREVFYPKNKVENFYIKEKYNPQINYYTEQLYSMFPEYCEIVMKGKDRVSIQDFRYEPMSVHDIDVSMALTLKLLDTTLDRFTEVYNILKTEYSNGVFVFFDEERGIEFHKTLDELFLEDVHLCRDWFPDYTFEKVYVRLNKSCKEHYVENKTQN